MMYMMYLFLTSLDCTISTHTLLVNLYLTFSLYACRSSQRTSVGNKNDLRTPGRRFNLQKSKIVIVTGFNHLSLLSIVSTMNTWESSHCFEKNILQTIVKKNSRKAWKRPLAVGYK